MDSPAEADLDEVGEHVKLLLTDIEETSELDAELELWAVKVELTEPEKVATESLRATLCDVELVLPEDVVTDADADVLLLDSD